MDGVEVTFTERSQKKKKNEDIGAQSVLGFQPD